MAVRSGLVEHGREAIETPVPGRLAVGDPALERLESRGHQLAAAHATDLLAAYEAGALEVLHVLEHGGEREGQRSREVGDRRGSPAQPLEDRAAVRLGYGNQEPVHGI